MARWKNVGLTVGATVTLIAAMLVLFPAAQAFSISSTTQTPTTATTGTITVVIDMEGNIFDFDTANVVVSNTNVLSGNGQLATPLGSCTTTSFTVSGGTPTSGPHTGYGPNTATGYGGGYLGLGYTGDGYTGTVTLTIGYNCPALASASGTIYYQVEIVPEHSPTYNIITPAKTLAKPSSGGSSGGGNSNSNSDPVVTGDGTKKAKADVPPGKKATVKLGNVHFEIESGEEGITVELEEIDDIATDSDGKKPSGYGFDLKSDKKSGKVTMTFTPDQVSEIFGDNDDDFSLQHLVDGKWVDESGAMTFSYDANGNLVVSIDLNKLESFSPFVLEGKAAEPSTPETPQTPEDPSSEGEPETSGTPSVGIVALIAALGAALVLRRRS